MKIDRIKGYYDTLDVRRVGGWVDRLNQTT
jgi:hypothetical protein